MTICNSILKDATNKLSIKNYFFDFQKNNPQFSLNQTIQAFLEFSRELAYDAEHCPEFAAACLPSKA